MNLNHLRFAVKVAQSGSFTEASGICNVTQPTLSNGIKQLELELGGKMFKRTTRHVSLTRFGDYILPSIHAMLNAQIDLKNNAKLHFEPDHKLLSIGFSPLVDIRMINTLVTPFIAENTDVTPHLKECFMDGLSTHLADGHIGLAIRPVQSSNIQSNATTNAQVFYQEPVYVVPRDHVSSPIHGTGPISIKELADEVFVLTPDTCGHASATRGWFDQGGKVLKEYAGQATNYQIMQDWAALGLASAILPWSKITPDNRKNARAVMIDPLTPAHITFELVWNTTSRNTKTVEQFLEHCVARLASLMDGLHMPDEQFSQ